MAGRPIRGRRPSSAVDCRLARGGTRPARAVRRAAPRADPRSAPDRVEHRHTQEGEAVTQRRHSGLVHAAVLAAAGVVLAVVIGPSWAALKADDPRSPGDP